MNFSFSHVASLQIEMLQLSEKEKQDLSQIFDEEPQLKLTNGRFISEFGNKIILWYKKEEKPEILSIVDKSFGNSVEY